MTHLDDIARIEIKHLRDLLKNANEDNKNLRSMNLTLQATVDMYLQRQEWEYRKSKL